MKELLMAKGARTLIDVCTQVKPDETVLVVTDMYRLDIAKVIAGVAMDRGAEAIVTVIQPRERNGQEPPAPVAEAMKKADVVFTPVTYSITHTHAVKNAAAEGTRLIVMTDFTPEMMRGGGIEADFEALKPVCMGVAQRLEEGADIRITTPAGTDITMSLEGRNGIGIHPLCENLGGFPDYAEAAIAPVEDTAEGIMVIDVGVLGWEYLFRQPLRCVVKSGRVVEIDGGDDADAALVGVPLDGQPLLEELPLAVLLTLDLASQGIAPAFQRLRLAGDGFRLPFVPGAEVVGFLQGHKEGKLVQPERLLVAKASKGRPLPVGGLSLEIGKGAVQQARLGGDHRPKVHPVGGEGGRILQIRLGEMPGLQQFVGADEHRVSGKGGEGLVG